MATLPSLSLSSSFPLLPLFHPPFLSLSCCLSLSLSRFYEWCREKGKQKQPYFLYFSGSAEEALEPAPVPTAEADSVSDKTGQSRLLTMAGLFDIWNSQSPGVGVVSCDGYLVMLDVVEQLTTKTCVVCLFA